jgi:hypothetical protein
MHAGNCVGKQSLQLLKIGPGPGGGGGAASTAAKTRPRHAGIAGSADLRALLLRTPRAGSQQ